MSVVVRRVPAWALTAAWVASAVLVVYLAGGPDAGIASVVAVVVTMLVFFAVVAVRRTNAAEIVGIVLCAGAAVSAVSAVLEIAQPWKVVAGVVVLPLAVYFLVDSAQTRSRSRDGDRLD
jgi:hypothetical protein